MNFKIIVIFIFIFIAGAGHSQSSSNRSVEEAEEHFAKGNYLMAIPIYTFNLRNDPNNIFLKYKLGVCYLNSRIKRNLAIPLLEEASKNAKVEEEVWMHLGKAYHLNNQIEDAIKSYEKFVEIKPKHSSDVELALYQCENAIQAMRKPKTVSFQNLGKMINSDEPDYYPFIDKDEMTLVFTSRRKENFGGKKVEMDGYRSSDIYFSTIDANGHWTEAKNGGRALNTNLDEQATGMRSDGMEIYVYMDHIDKYGDIYISERKDLETDFLRPKIVEEPINSKIETSGCVSEDGNLLIFTRRDKMSDNSDLYMSRRIPSGKWGIPQKLPESINTNYNEGMPYLSYDGKTLYYSCDGVNSIGGYDLFKVSWDQKTNTFGKPQNLGFPLNSTDDDLSICVTQDNRLAYVSAYRPDGLGDLDIYRVKFEDVEPVSVIYTGKFFIGDTIASHQPGSYAIEITVTNLKTNFEYVFVPHSKTGKYVMALPAGKYKLVTYSEGYSRHKEEFEVSDQGRINMERSKDFLLQKSKN